MKDVRGLRVVDGKGIERGGIGIGDQGLIEQRVTLRPRLEGVAVMRLAMRRFAMGKYTRKSGLGSGGGDGGRRGTFFSN